MSKNPGKRIGRPPIGERAMTNSERQARYRSRRKQMHHVQFACHTKTEADALREFCKDWLTNYRAQNSE